jgi:pyruvate dehydrogenase E2 component (dihydrolipoamide acetyltransferase)
MNILMPQLGETVAEGKITKWFKATGDAVRPGDNLFEIETDKVSMEVPATEAGVLSEIRVPEGEVAPVGAIVGVIGDGAGGAVSAPAKPAPAAADAPKTPASSADVPAAADRAAVKAPQQPIKLDPFFEVCTPERNFGPARLSGGISVTPLARRLASEAGIVLSRLRGSGAHGRIVARDVENAPRPQSAPSHTAFAEGPTADQVKALYDPAGYEEVPLDGMRKTIATRLQQAKQTIPHFYLTADITIDRLLAVREEVNAAAPKDRDGKPAFKLSLNDFIIRALALALQHVPAANVAWAGDRILRFKHSDVCVAPWRWMAG